MWSRHFIFHALTLVLISDQVFICGQAFRIWYVDSLTKYIYEL